ncbi:MAG: 5-(carboxyamino)imidazole ribonucleotide mutase [Gammaproteobacteria bacterium RIFCSPLOWO2_12_47_11]|nr:MAG: 5-(carboxyamino)imidazole ribonucleotide mutase [Gammaproteobacteria bacterium RIFCSPLOWO2_12_47_11]
MKKKNPVEVAILMGSDSDWPTLKAAADVCAEFKVATEVRVISAHRTPLDMTEYARTAHEKGIKIIIAGAGGAAHLPGMIASLTPLPVIGVPVESQSLQGLDSLLSIAQMPAGVPVATVAIGGGRNAGLLALEILATSNRKLLDKIIQFKAILAKVSREKDRNLKKKVFTSRKK